MYLLVVPENNCSSNWLRAILSLYVLRVLQDSGSRHGYGIVVELERVVGVRVKGGTLYPVLNRLEASGLVFSTWVPGVGGPGRKMYEISPAGLDSLSKQTSEWLEFVETSSAFLAGPSRHSERVS